MVSRHPLREGVIAGLIGAAAVAIWFFLLDAMAGRPFFTPAVLGAALFGLLGGSFGGHGLAVHVIAFTVVHVAAFVAVGVIAAYATNASQRKPSMFSGLIVLFLVFEVSYALAVRLLSASDLFGVYAWWQFGVANFLAAFAMGRFIWRTHHPEVVHDWAELREARR